MHFGVGVGVGVGGEVEGAVIEKRYKKPKIQIPHSPDSAQH